jgi:hypothetical protein
MTHSCQALRYLKQPLIQFLDIHVSINTIGLKYDSYLALYKLNIRPFTQQIIPQRLPSQACIARKMLLKRPFLFPSLRRCRRVVSSSTAK